MKFFIGSILLAVIAGVSLAQTTTKKSENVSGYFGKAEVSLVNSEEGKIAVVVYHPRSNWVDSDNTNPRVFVVQLLSNSAEPDRWSANARLLVGDKALALIRGNGTNLLFHLSDNEVPPSLKQFKFVSYPSLGIATYGASGKLDPATIQNLKTYGTIATPK